MKFITALGAFAASGYLSAALTAAPVLLAAAPAADRSTSVELAPLQPGLDYHSFANADQFRVTRIELDLRVDFFFKTVSGTAGLAVKRLDPAATQLVLDTRDLNISDVTVKAQNVLGATSKDETTWVSRPFHLERKDPVLGQALVIDLPPSSRNNLFVRIDYESSPTAPALQWIDPSQTAGKSRGFFYTQSEPIGARSWIPLQDTPQVRVTYKATIHTPNDVRAVMSAKSDPTAPRNGLYTFDMSEAIPSYLIALAVGDIEFKATGPRTGVYAEKALLKKAAAEFSDTESMIATGEKLFGPYRWDRYDILVMPPGFPDGGMENPRLSFISPTVIAGDKSLVSVIAHELAHSWSGNLVTNATWRDLWLNEGFTDYLESRIVNAVYGEKREMMERVLGLHALEGNLAKLAPQDQTLAIDLRNRDPSLAFSEVPYEKGRLFLTFLDTRFGRDRFDTFLRGYFDHFAFKSLTTEQFLEYLQRELLDRYPGIVKSDEVSAWVHKPGIPEFAVRPVSGEFAPVDEARVAWITGHATVKDLKRQSSVWATQQWLYFLDEMPADLTRAQMTELDRTFDLSRTANAEIGHSWFSLAIRNRYQPADMALEHYLETIGRVKLIAPLYEEMMKTPAGATQAKRVYAIARPRYHPAAAAAVDAIVHPDEDEDRDSNEQ